MDVRKQRASRPFPPDVVAIANHALDVPSPACANPSPETIRNGELCQIGSENGPIDWIVWGDSHAWAMQESFNQWLRAHGGRGFLLSGLGCPPLIGYVRERYSPPCNSMGSAALDLIKSRNIKNVVLVSSWANWFGDHRDFSDSEAVSTTVEQSRAALTRSFVTTLWQLKSLGTRVWIMEPLPQARYDVPSTLAKDSFFSRASNLSFSREEYFDRTRIVFSLFDRYRSEFFATIEIGRSMCSSGTCIASRNGAPLYADQNHIALSQSEFFAKLLLESEKRSSLP
ncbi:SGNH hydrolase domain-containing protein [Bradyrhizobium sp. RDM12]